MAALVICHPARDTLPKRAILRASMGICSIKEHAIEKGEPLGWWGLPFLNLFKIRE
jgi:hypothetical protein